MITATEPRSRPRARAAVVVYDGSRPWHAKYLAHWTPRTVYPKTLYQIPIRIENAGTLPWRAGEGYSLSTRWYKDGKLFDDSAPRIPVAKDVLPGQALTLSVGLVARNNFGEDLAPGDYTLVFDMVQSQERWFSYAGDTPLQVPVTVIGADSGVGGTAARHGAAARRAVRIVREIKKAGRIKMFLGASLRGLSTAPTQGNYRTITAAAAPFRPSACAVK